MAIGGLGRGGSGEDANRVALFFPVGPEGPPPHRPAMGSVWPQVLKKKKKKNDEYNLARPSSRSKKRGRCDKSRKQAEVRLCVIVWDGGLEWNA